MSRRKNDSERHNKQCVPALNRQSRDCSSPQPILLTDLSLKYVTVLLITVLGQVTHLYEREQEAHSEVGQPVDGPGDHEGSRPVGLFKQLPGQDEGDAP